MATSISYRHGTSAEHEAFRGAPSEITVSTDEQTLYVHSGDQERPGTPLARADLVNVETATLKEKGLLDTKLTNFMNGNYTNIVNNQNPDLGLAIANYLDLKNQIGIDLTPYAKSDMSNVDTGSLASGRPGTGTDLNLAYANLSNVTNNTIKNNKVLDKDLNDISQSGKEVVIDTIANSSLDYASKTYVRNYVDENIPSTTGFEETINKTQYINSEDTEANKQKKYPSVSAVLTYISDELPSEFVLGDLSNVRDWTSASLTSDLYEIQSLCSSGGSNYAVNDVITTNITINQSEITPVATQLKINVTEVDENGAITDYELDPNLVQQTISETTYTDSSKGAVFTVQTKQDALLVGKLAKADLSNTDALSKTLANTTYLKKTDAQSTYATITAMGNKVDKTSSASQVYVTNSNGAQSTITYSAEPLNNTIAYRDNNGCVTTGTPTGVNDATPKQYVDNGLSGKQATLVSGTNIKTINNTSLLGSGNITVATSTQGGKADTAIQPGDNVSGLNNDAGYITNTVNNLTNYTLSSSLATVATTGKYNDLTNKPSIPNVTNTYDATSADGMSGQAVDSAINSYDNNTIAPRNYVKGVAGNVSGIIPKKIAIYQKATDAQAASNADPDLLAFSLS